MLSLTTQSSCQGTIHVLHIYRQTSQIIISDSYFNNYQQPQPLVLPHLPSSSFTENFLEKAIYTAPSPSSLSCIQSITKVALWICKGASSKRGLLSLNPRFWFDWREMGSRNPQTHSNSRGSENAEGGLTCPSNDPLLPLGSSLVGIQKLHSLWIFTFMVWTFSVSLDEVFLFCHSSLKS